MADRRLTYTVGFNADTTQLKVAMADVAKSLQQLGNKPSMAPNLQQASAAAAELARNLQLATNAETGKLDLRVFNQSLIQSGKNLQYYKDQLSLLGPTGQDAFLKVARSIVQAETPLKRTNALFDKLWLTMKNTMRWQLTSSVLHSFIGGIQTAYGYAQNLNKSLNNIRIVTQKSTADMADFAKQANNAAKDLSTTTTKYTDASLIYYQQGLSDTEVEGRANTTIKLMNVARESAEDASSQMTAVWNNFYDGSKSLEYYADVMVKLGATTASSSSEIATGLEKFAAVAGTIGLSYEYAAAALATVTAQTRQSAEVVGTAYRTLFARIQGLSLGETLDDGTDLTKYSKALASVGVNIKTTSGELKDMDDILDELGAKWQTLAKDQQVALAETVAGVRQYTSLIALMDNWDFFKENLATAKGSSGALEEQAQIYAESWEAARNRVRAASEDIYDSIINPDLFINLDNILTPVLTTLANIIDSMDGLNGLLTIGGLLINKVWGDKIAQSMRDAASNLGIIEQKEASRAQILREEAALLAKNIALSKSGEDSTTIEAQRIISWAKIVELEGKASNYMDTLDENQKAILKIDLERVRALQQQLDLLAEQAKYAKEKAQDYTENLSDRINNDKNKDGAWKDRIKDISYGTAKDGRELKYNQTKQNAYNAINQALGAEDEQKAFHILNTELEQSVIKYAKYKTVQEQLINSQGKVTEEVINTAKSVGILDEKTDASKFFKGDFNRQLIQSKGEVNQLEKAIIAIGDGTEAFTVKVNRLTGQYTIQAVASKNVSDTTKVVNEEMGILSENIGKNIYQSRDWANTIVQTGQAFMQLNMIFMSIKNLGRVFSDEDMTAGERFTTLLTGLGMLLPSIISLWNTLNTIKFTSIAVDKLATTGLTKWIVKLIIGTKATEADTAAQIANKIARLDLIAIIGLVALAIYGLVKVYNKEADALKKAQEQAEKSKEKYNELKTAYDELKSSLEDYNGARDALNELMRGTEEWKDAVDELNQKVLELLKTYPELAQYISNTNGILEISQTGQDYIINKQKQEATDQYRQVLIDDIKVAGATSTKSENLIKKEFEDLVNENAATAAQMITRQDTDKALELIKNFGIEFFDNINNLYDYFDDPSKAERLQEYVIQLSQIPDKIEGNIKQVKILNQQLGQSLLEDTKYNTDYVFSNQISTLLGNWVTKSLEDNPNLELKDLEIVEQTQNYANALKALSDSVSGEQAQQALANLALGITDFSELTQEEIDKLLQKFEIPEDLDLDSKNDQEWLAGLAEEWDKTLSIFNISTKDFINNLLTASNAYTEFSNNIPTNLSISARKAYENADIDTLSNTDKSFVATTFSRASVAGQDVLDQAVKILNTQGIEAFRDFADQIDLSAGSVEGITQDFADFDKIVDKLDVGSTIDEEQFNTLTDLNEEAGKYFTRMRDGSYKLTGDAQKFYDLVNGSEIEKAQNEIGKIQDRITAQEAIAAKGYDFDQLINDLSWYKSHENDWFTNLQQILEITQAYGGQDENSRIFYDKVQQLLENGNIGKGDYEQLIKLAKEAEGAFKNSAETIQAEKDSIVELEGSMLSYATSTIQLINAQKKGNVTEQQRLSALKNIATQTDKGKVALAKYNEVVEQYGEESKEAKKAADELWRALRQIDIDNAAEQIRNIIGEVTELEDLDDTAIYGIRDAFREVYGDKITANFVKENWDKVQAFINGTDEMQQAAADFMYYYNEEFNLKSILLEIDLDNALNKINGIEDKFNLLKKVIEDNDILIKLDGTADLSQLYSSLYILLGDANKVASVLNAIGITDLTIDSSDLEELAKVTQFAMLGEESGYYYTPEQIQQIQTRIKVSGTYPNTSTPGNTVTTSKGGGGSSQKTANLMDEKTHADLDDRYHEIDRELENQEDLLNKINTAADRAYGTGRLNKYVEALKELNKKADIQQSKIGLAEHFLEVDQEELQKQFNGALNIDAETGEIKNYQDVLDRILDKYNSFAREYNAYIEKYNNMTVKQQEAAAQELEDWEKRKDEAEEEFEAQKKALDQYEETLDVIKEMREAWEDTMRAIEDQKLKEITYKLELVLDVKNARDMVDKFSKKIAESFGDALTHGIKVAKIDEILVNREAALYSDYLSQYNALTQRLKEANEFTDVTAIKDALSDLESKIISSGEVLLEWIDSIETMLPDAIDAAKERFEEFTKQLEHNNSILSTIKELYQLQGVSTKTQEGYNRLVRNAQERLDIAVNNSTLNRQWATRAKNSLEQAQKSLDDLMAEYAGQVTNANPFPWEQDVRYDTLKANRDALLEEYRQAQEAMFTSAKEAMELAQEMYLLGVERTVSEFEQKLTDGLNLDILQEKYDHFIEQEGRYFDQVNEAYQVASWYNKLQQDIDKATDNSTKARLKALQEEIDLRREGGTLSQYDLDILEAKYKVLQAQLALEDEANNKNQLRLVRDRQGNWNYQYTADPNAIADKQQELMDAENEWYNIAKKQTEEVTKEIIDNWKECKDAIEELYSDMNNYVYDEEQQRYVLTEEALAREAEIRKYYAEKNKYLEQEKQNAIKDMTEAGNLVIEGFENTYADALDNMTNSTIDFEDILQEALSNIEGYFEDYNDTMSWVAEETGTKISDLDKVTNEVAKSTDEVAAAAKRAINPIWDMTDAIHDLSEEYAQLAIDIQEVIDKMKELAGQTADRIEDSSKGGTSSSGSLNITWDPEIDYSSALIGYIRNGGKTTDDKFLRLIAEREAKIKDLNLEGSVVDSKTLIDLFKLYVAGDYEVIKFVNSLNNYLDEKTIKDFLHAEGVPGYDTGGYTGAFEDAKLAFLHQKELVLNQTDTANILSAVSAIRMLSPEMLTSISKILDGNAIASGALMGEKISSVQSGASAGPIEQNVHIEASFPNVTNHSEIEEAFATLVNDAAQWVRRRRD